MSAEHLKKELAKLQTQLEQLEAGRLKIGHQSGVPSQPPGTIMDQIADVRRKIAEYEGLLRSRPDA